MLTDLEIVNGILDIEFDKYIYNYTVMVNNDIEYLDMQYKTENNSYVNIRNNNLKNNNIVYLDVYNDKESLTYTFEVYKESDNSVNTISDYKESLEVVDNPHYFLKLQIVSISLVFLLIIVFSLLFFRRKN